MQDTIMLYLSGYSALAAVQYDGTSDSASAYGQAAQGISASESQWEQLQEALPADTADMLAANGITPESGGTFSLESALDYIWQLIVQEAAAPMRLAAALIAVVLMAALSKSAADNENSSMKRVFSAVGVLAGAVMSISAISGCIVEITEILRSCAAFMIAFVPIYTGVLAVLGKAATASAVNITVLSATQLFSQVAVNMLMPLCGTVLGLSVTGAVHPELNTEKLGELIKKLVIRGLTLIMTIFMGVLSLQTFSANAADNVLIRTAKLAVSSGVPIIGGTISDAVNTVAGSMSLLKSTLGTYGVVAAVIMTAPILISAAGYKLAVELANAIAEIMGIKELGTLFSSCASVMSIVIAVMCCFLLMNVIAIIILLALSAG